MTHKSFLEIMRWYCDEKIIFYSSNRQARYAIKSVDDTGCEVQRLDANESERVTLNGYESRLAWLRNNLGTGDRTELEGTVARQMCYLQSAELALAETRKKVVLLDAPDKTAKNFVGLVEEMSSPQLYKPMIVAIVVQAIAEGELIENRIHFDWLLPKFIAKFKQLGKDVTEQQLAEGFGRMAVDFFWLLAHVDVAEPLAVDQPSASQIRKRVRYAAFKEPYWTALQDAACRSDVLSTIARKWDIRMDEQPVGPWPVPSELSSAVERLIHDIDSEGFTFEPWQVATFVTALRTKPFVILAGVSGTGKSKLPSLVADLTGGYCKRISVRPDWTDSSEVLGYVDLQGTFRPGVFLIETKAAALEAESQFFCLIDEMNLACVEYYFAEILSCIEDRKPKESGGFQSGILLSLQLNESHAEWNEQTIPANLAIVGTVNMDESTHGFSRKVLDRAFTIELSEVDLDWSPDGPAKSAKVDRVKWPVAFWHTRATRLSELNNLSASSIALIQSSIDLLKRINECLTCSQLQVGYRTRDEMILFLLNADEVRSAFRTRDGQPVDPLDLVLSMKILPRIVGGSNAIRRTLLGLLGITIQGQPYNDEDAVKSQVDKWDKARRPATLAGAKLPRSAARLCLMWDRLEAEGFTSYWL